MMALILGNKGLYCVINLHEVAFSSLGVLASSLMSFLTPENCFFTLPGLYSLEIKK